VHPGVECNTGKSWCRMTVIEVIDASRQILKDELVSTRSFPDNSSSFYKDSELLTWLNWSQLDLQKKIVQSFENWFVTATSITLIAGVESYSLPCATMKIVRVEDNRNPLAPIEILPMTFNDKDKYLYPLVRTNVSSVGTVHRYAIKGDKFIFRPIPNKAETNAIQVHYVYRLADLVSQSEVSEIPVEYHEALVWGIVKRGMSKGEATAEAIAAAVGTYNEMIADLRISSEDRQIQRSRSVRRKKNWS
jgi:hypothetical protein